jgi:hypothetical protein
VDTCFLLTFFKFIPKLAVLPHVFSLGHGATERNGDSWILIAKFD